MHTQKQTKAVYMKGDSEKCRHEAMTAVPPEPCIWSNLANYVSYTLTQQPTIPAVRANLTLLGKNGFDSSLETSQVGTHKACVCFLT